MTAIILLLFVCAVLFAGCDVSSESDQEQSLKVYSFSGENDFISVSNGVIVLNAKNEICYGGNLKVKADEFVDVTTYATTLYINIGNEKKVLLSGGVEDLAGETIDISGDIGRISGDILRDSDTDKLADNLWFELKTTDLSGEENTYQIHLEMMEVTRESEEFIHCFRFSAPASDKPGCFFC